MTVKTEIALFVQDFRNRETFHDVIRSLISIYDAKEVEKKLANIKTDYVVINLYERTIKFHSQTTKEN